MTDTDPNEVISRSFSEMDTSLTDTSDSVSNFNKDLHQMRQGFNDAKRDMIGFERSLSTGLNQAIRGIITQGDTLSDVFKRIRDQMINSAVNAAISPVTGQLGSAIAGVLPFADGAGFTQGRVIPFASGGVVTGPTRFPMRGGMGLMGEAGPEAIMPLTRGADGKLGVRAQTGAAPIQVVMNINTPDATGFHRSQNQIAARVSRILGQAARHR